MKTKSITFITAPSSLGLRPNSESLEPTTWKAADAYLETGVAQRVGASVIRLQHPKYEFDAQTGTRIRNGLSIRTFSIQLAAEVQKTLAAGNVPVVFGGDCSILLGCLLGAKRVGGNGLVHVDGHCDYFHPGNYDSKTRLGSVAGMDLALATGKGERLLTHFDEYAEPLVKEADAFHIGERNYGSEAFKQSYGDILNTAIHFTSIQKMLKAGMEASALKIVARLKEKRQQKVWLHVDFDILDESVMPAVDSPGSPGLDFKQLETFLTTLLKSGLFIGMDFTIYDPGLDKERKYVRSLSGIIESCCRI
jgi:arginase